MFNIPLDITQNVHYLFLLYFNHSHNCIFRIILNSSTTFSSTYIVDNFCVVLWQLNDKTKHRKLYINWIWDIKKFNLIQNKYSSSITCCFIETSPTLLMLCYKLMCNEVPVSSKSSPEAKSDLINVLLYWYLSIMYYHGVNIGKNH